MLFAPLALLLCGFQSGGATVVEPVYPSSAYQGGTVVAALEISDGSVRRVRVLSGDKPFVDPATAALRQWRFPKERGDRPALVIVNFRGPNLYAVGSADKGLDAMRVPDSLPRPKGVVEPKYPPNSLGRGGVIVHLKLTSKGSISESEVLKGSGDLTQACTEAVRAWKLEPPKSSSGTAAGSDAYAVCVFREPVLSPPR
jgi:outer membrane biosynthesis protein TonB